MQSEPTAHPSVVRRSASPRRPVVLVPPDALAELLERRRNAISWVSRADIEQLFREAQRIPITR